MAGLGNRGAGSNGLGGTVAAGGSVDGSSAAGVLGSRGGGLSSGDGSGGRGLLLTVTGRDAELGAVLVLAGYIVDDLDAVAVGAAGGLEVRGRGPGQASAVGDALGEGRSELDDVGGWSLEEEHGDRVRGGWLPGDSELLARGDDLLGAWLVCLIV